MSTRSPIISCGGKLSKRCCDHDTSLFPVSVFLSPIFLLRYPFTFFFEFELVVRYIPKRLPIVIVCTFIDRQSNLNY